MTMKNPENPHKNQIIASRGSKLALWQANHVKSLLESEGFQAAIKVIKTTGDRIQDRFLHEIGGKGLFVKEIEQALLDDSADLAVHSLKDLPAKTPTEFQLAAMLPRHEATDVLILHPKFAASLGLEKGNKKIAEVLGEEEISRFGPIKIATGSLRRHSLLKEASKKIDVIPIRGNVDTRIEKLENSDWQGLILAEASLERLDIQDSLFLRRLDPDWFIPSSAQGALVIETRAGSDLTETLDKLSCPLTRRHVTIERRILEKLGGDCTMPFGCYFREDPKDSGKVIGDAVILNNDGKSCRAQIHTNIPTSLQTSHSKANALDLGGQRKTEQNLIESLAERMIQALKDNDANTILRDINLPGV